MIAARKILDTLKARLPQNTQTKFSYPVLHKDNEKIYLAVFLAETIQGRYGEPALSAPTMALLCDITTGDIKNIDQTIGDFYDFTPRKIYSMPSERAFTEYDYDDLYELIDRTRQMYQELSGTGRYLSIYALYMEKLISMIPNDHVELYNRISISYQSAGQMMEANNTSKEAQVLPFVEEKQNEVPETAQESKQPENAFTQESFPFSDDNIKQETIKPNEEPAKDEKTESNEVQETTSKMTWRPRINLSTMPETQFKVLSRLADNVQLLSRDNNMMRYAYPVFCFEENRTTDANIWVELQARIKNGTLKEGHMKTPERNQIYMTCINGKNGKCVFGRCPYYAAMYIKQLKELDPQELERQRTIYQQNKERVDQKYVDKFNVPFTVPRGATKEDWGKYKNISESGKVFFDKISDTQGRISWLEEDDTPHTVVMNLDGFLSENPLSITDVNNNIIPKDVLGSVLAEFIKQTAVREEQPTSNPSQNEVKKEVHSEKPIPVAENNTKSKVSVQETQENTIQETVKEDARQTPVSVKTDKVDKPTIPNPKQAETSHDKKKTQNIAVSSLIGANTYTGKYLLSQNFNDFYGMLCLGEEKSNNEIIDNIFALLKQKGCKDLFRTTLRKLPEKLRTDTLYVVEVTNDLTGISKLKRFTPDTKILLCGEKTHLDELTNQAKFVRALYGRTIVQATPINYDKMYNELIPFLPTHLQESAKKSESKSAYFSWIKSTPMPQNDEMIPYYIARLCKLENRLVFVKKENKPQK